MDLLAALLTLAAAAVPAAPGTIGELPTAPAGAQAAPLRTDEIVAGWRGALATGVAGKAGGRRLESDRLNSRLLLYLGAQADGAWTEGLRRAARLRLRLFTGGEGTIYAPSEGDAEAAFLLGRPELRFVVGRVELGRYPTLAVDALAQASTLPCFEGALSLAGDALRLHYFVSPIEGAWVYYHGGAHVPHRAGWASESDRPAAASAARLRTSAVLPGAILLSLQGDFLKMWRRGDLLVSAEGSLGYPVLQQSTLLSAVVRWSGYARRGTARDTTEDESELIALAAVSLEL
jgi:hypothetical protein